LNSTVFYLIYLFKNYRGEGKNTAKTADSVVFAESSASALEHSNINSLEATSSLNAIDQKSIASIQLAPESCLRREYFLIVWSTEFQGLVLAQRPRFFQNTSQNAKLSSSNLSESSAGALETVQTAEDLQDRRQNLQVMCSFDTGFISLILEGIEAATKFSQARLSVEVEIDSSRSSDWAHEWQLLMATMPSVESNSKRLEQLLTRQIQQQEEFWQRSASYRKQAEVAEALQIQNVELSNAIRLKDDFLNNVGQELRTPLTTIKTALTLLNSPTIKPPQRQRYMDLIAKECDRQSSLITSLLDLVQLEQVVDQSSFQPIRIADVVPGVVSTYQPIAKEKGIMLAYTVPEDLPSVSCMNNWLKQIVIHLLNNSIKFTPAGGQVKVRAKQQGDYVQLEFRDTGIGIAPGEIPKIFERFYRIRQASEESIGGAGLGLTIVQQLLIQCGGSISVRSKLGEGSVFNVLLPVYKSELDQTSE
jgi:signal transduction histidine kinase